MRYCGKVGYCWTEEKILPDGTPTGVYVEKSEERTYMGDILKMDSRVSSSDKVNSDIELSNRLSILADPFAFEKFPYIKYAEIMGTKWKVVTTEVQYPRLLLNIGGVYNGE